VSSNNFTFGREGEEVVMNEYIDKGFRLIAKNFEVYLKDSRGRRAEIDLIMFKDNIIHIVEVKSRNNLKFGEAINQITYQKLKHLQFAYQIFISKNPIYKGYNAQIDVAVVQANKPLNIIFNAVSF
jgi:putative endonuclease